MNRRRMLVGVLGMLCLGACSSLPARRARTAAPGGEGRAGTTPHTRNRAPRASTGALRLDVKPVTAPGALARTTGHCDLQGVLAAEGSEALAQVACDRDLQVEMDLAEGLRVATTASARQSLGRQRHLGGDTQQARLDYEEAIRQDTQGRDPTAVSDFARINLGLLLHEQGDQAGAHAQLRGVLDHADDPAVRGAAYHNLALVLLEQGDTDGALDAARQAEQLLRQALGDAHGSVGAALNARGVIHAERDELDEAIEALGDAVDTRTLALGTEHPATAASYTNLGVALGLRGDWGEAVLAHQQALAIDAVVLGPNHATTAADHGHLGSALLALGRPEQARRSFHEALAILEPVRAADDPEVDQLHRWITACDEAEAVAER